MSHEPIPSGAAPMSTSVFLSYARGDDEPFVRRLYDDLTAAGFDVWFDRVSMPGRGLTFTQEIGRAIDARDRLVLILGPEAVRSEYVEKEWRYAFDAGKVINPIGELARKALIVVEGHEPQRRVSMHDLIHDYVSDSGECVQTLAGHGDAVISVSVTPASTHGRSVSSATASSRRPAASRCPHSEPRPRKYPRPSQGARRSSGAHGQNRRSPRVAR